MFLQLILLSYLAIGSALLLAMTIAFICLGTERVEFRGFVVSTDHPCAAGQQFGHFQKRQQNDFSSIAADYGLAYVVNLRHARELASSK